MHQETFTVTVSNDAVDWIRSQVQSGHFASHEDAIRAGISLLRDEWEFEQAMRSDELARAIAESYDEAKRNPESLIPAAEVIRAMDERHRSRLNKVA